MAPQGAGVCSVSLGACVACSDSTTVTGHVHRDICFMVSPSRIIVMVICSVLTHSWIPSLFVACLNTSVLLPCCFCSVD